MAFKLIQHFCTYLGLIQVLVVVDDAIMQARVKRQSELSKPKLTFYHLLLFLRLFIFKTDEYLTSMVLVLFLLVALIPKLLCHGMLSFVLFIFCLILIP